MRTALLVIDMQEGSFTPRTARHDTAGLIARINALATRVRNAGGAVIFIQHEGALGDPHAPGHPGHALLPELHIEPHDVIVAKANCDAFLDTELQAKLDALGATRLIITGCATDFCVDTTVRAALARGIATVVPADGHTTANRVHLSAEQIIAHHNAIWSDFISPAGAALVVACADVSVT